MIDEGKLREAKVLISMHTSNSMLDCDKMFIVDFLLMNKTVEKELKTRINGHINTLQGTKSI